MNDTSSPRCCSSGWYRLTSTMDLPLGDDGPVDAQANLHLTD